jgi:Flp pilus assembly protein TadG
MRSFRPRLPVLGAPSRGQALVEFALVSPLLLMFSFVTIDVGRVIYTYSAISSAAREGARTLSLRTANSTDCLAIARMEAAGQAFPLQMDPNSLIADSDPNNPSGPLQPGTPQRGQGLIYIWPAVSLSTPQDQGTNCDGPQRQVPPNVRHVAVEIQYRFVPLTPIANGTDFTIKVVSVEHTEY